MDYSQGIVRRRRVIPPSNSFFSNTGAGASDANSETTAWVNAVVSAGGTVSQTQRGRVDTLITSLKGHSLFSANSRLWLHAGESVDQQARIDIMGLATATTSGHAPTLGAGGYTGNASSQYIDYGTKPSNYTQNSASYGGYDRTSSTTAGSVALLGTYDGANCIADLQPKADAGGSNARINTDTGFIMSGGNANRQGFHVASMRASGDQELYINGASVTVGAAASTSIAGLPNFYGLARNNNGSADIFCDDQIAAFWLGAGLSDTDAANLSTDVNAYMTAWGVNVY